MKRSQARRLFDILLDGMWHINGELAKQISSSPAGFCMRLTARVHDLRQLGFDIRCEAIDTRRGVFKYRMVTPPEEIDIEDMTLKGLMRDPNVNLTDPKWLVDRSKQETIF